MKVASSIQYRGVIAATVVLLFLWIGPAPASARHATIRNFPPAPHRAPAGTPPADLAAAIKAAGAELHWEVAGESPGAVKLRFRIRAHEAIVVIGYDDSNYWIDYSDSINLDYNPNDYRVPGRSGRLVKGPRIHHNYNIWVDQLYREVERQMQTPPKAVVGNQIPSKAPILIADELEKLDALRRRGILTQEEFDRQKMKLLAP